MSNGAGDRMYLSVFGILLVVWLVSLVAFKVAGAAIHLLLILAVVSLVMHFVRGRTAA